MESQLRLYDNQVDYSTVYLNIAEVTNYTPAAPESAGTRMKNGLAKNFESLITALTNLLIFIITTCPFWIPLAVIAAVILSAVRRHNRKIYRISEEEKVRSSAPRKSEELPDAEQDDTSDDSRD